MSARSLKWIWILAGTWVITSTAGAAPLFTYLTCTETPQTSLNVNFHTDANAPGIVRFDTVSRGGDPDAYAFRVDTEVRTVPGLEVFVTRYVHHATLTGLLPSQRYYYVAGSEAGGFSPEYSFRTLPADDRAIRLITGGDMDTNGTVRSLLALAAAQSPDLALLGGDLAYANGLVENWALWDDWLGNWQDTMIRPDGCQIPMVLAIGNHEVEGQFNGSREGVPFFFTYFRQQPQEQTYFTMSLGASTQLYVLDSGPVSSPEGAQTEWLRERLAETARVPVKLALYHVPLFPGHRSPMDPINTAEREHWQPLFDQYRLTFGLENHDHVVKRTKAIRGDAPHPDGTIYLGDGCFGRPPRPALQEDQWYIETALPENHFWIIDIGGGYGGRRPPITARAIGLDGATLDTVSLPGEGGPLTADLDGDFKVSLSELLRLIQLYNAGEFHCAPESEDGFAPGPGNQDCYPHDTDYNPQNGRIDLSELLRLIQIYNAGTYHECTENETSEDGLCLGPTVP